MVDVQVFGNGNGRTETGDRGSSCLGFLRWIGIRLGSSPHFEYAREQLSRLSKIDRGSLGFGNSLKVFSAVDKYAFAGVSELVRFRQLNVGMFEFCNLSSLQWLVNYYS